MITVLHTDDDERALKSLLGVVNSRVISFFYGGRAVKSARKLFPKIVVNNLREFPLPLIYEDTRLVAHVERMLKLHADLAAAKSPDAQTRLQREIAATDRAIDQLVYQLYDLTPEEIALVEQATAPVVRSAVEDNTEPPSAVPAPPPPEAYAQAEADAAHHYFVKEPPPTAQE